MSKNKVRPLSELYDILIDYMNLRSHYVSIFIYNQIDWLGRVNGEISHDEKIILRNDFNSNKPTLSLHQEYYLNRWFNKKEHIKDDDAWWNYPWTFRRDENTRIEINKIKNKFLNKLRNQAYEKEQQ